MTRLKILYFLIIFLLFIVAIFSLQTKIVISPYEPPIDPKKKYNYACKDLICIVGLKEEYKGHNKSGFYKVFDYPVYSWNNRLIIRNPSNKNKTYNLIVRVINNYNKEVLHTEYFSNKELAYNSSFQMYLDENIINDYLVDEFDQIIIRISLYDNNNDNTVKVNRKPLEEKEVILVKKGSLNQVMQSFRTCYKKNEVICPYLAIIDKSINSGSNISETKFIIVNPKNNLSKGEYLIDLKVFKDISNKPTFYYTDTLNFAEGKVAIVFDLHKESFYNKNADSYGKINKNDTIIITLSQYNERESVVYSEKKYIYRGFR